MLVEIGGTVGDIESLPFLEAIRQFRQEAGRGNAINVHLTLVPYIKASDELKTKPTQHSVKELLSIGIQPDILLCRTDRAAAGRRQEEDRALLQRAGRGRHQRQGRALDLRGAAPVRRRGPRRDPARPPLAAALRPGPLEVGEPRQPDQEPGRRGGHRGRRQVRGLRRLLQVAQRGALARRDREQRPRQAPLRRRRDARGRPVPRRALPGRRDPRSRRLRTPRRRGHDEGHPLRAREEGAVLRDLPGPPDGGDRVRAQRRAASRAPTPPSSRTSRPTRSSSSCAT